MRCDIDFIKSNFRNNNKLGLRKACSFHKAVSWGSTQEVFYFAKHLRTSCTTLSFDVPLGGLEYYPGRGADECSFGLAVLCPGGVCVAPSGYCTRAGSVAFRSNSLDARLAALAWSSFCPLRKVLLRWVNVTCQMMASCSLVPRLWCSCLFSATSCFSVGLVGSYAQQDPEESLSMPYWKYAAFCSKNCSCKAELWKLYLNYLLCIRGTCALPAVGR